MVKRYGALVLVFVLLAVGAFCAGRYYQAEWRVGSGHKTDASDALPVADADSKGKDVDSG